MKCTGTASRIWLPTEIRVVHKIILSIIEINWIYEMNFIIETRFPQIAIANWSLINKHPLDIPKWYDFLTVSYVVSPVLLINCLVYYIVVVAASYLLKFNLRLQNFLPPLVSYFLHFLATSRVDLNLIVLRSLAGRGTSASDHPTIWNGVLHYSLKICKYFLLPSKLQFFLSFFSSVFLSRFLLCSWSEARGWGFINFIILFVIFDGH